MNNSRFITPPSTVEKGSNPTVVLIDANTQDINELHVFLMSSTQDFDVYLYDGNYGDLEYLNYITNHSDWILIHQASQITIQNFDRQSKFGENQIMQYPVEYFEQIQQQTIDKKVENIV
jgi:hypothetical protein